MKLGRSGVSGWLALGPTWAACAGISARGPSNSPGSATAAPNNQANSSVRPPELPGAKLGRLQGPQLLIPDAVESEFAFLTGSEVPQVRKARRDPSHQSRCPEGGSGFQGVEADTAHS